MAETTLFVALFSFGVAMVMVFSFVIFYGAPFLPTRRSRVAEALDLLDLRAEQTLLELGSGDGRLLRAAAQRGIRSIGYELNPVLVWWSRLRCLRYRRLVTIQLANYWQVSLPPADGIYVFLLQPYMAKLDAKLTREITQPIKLVSFAFPVPGKRPAKSQRGLLLYAYKPPV